MCLGQFYEFSIYFRRTSLGIIVDYRVWVSERTKAKHKGFPTMGGLNNNNKNTLLISKPLGMKYQWA